MKTILRLFVALTLLLALFSCTEKEETNTPLQPVSFTDVHLNDCFWAPKIDENQKVSIPSAFQKSEETGRVDNFALAAGLIEGEHQGDFPIDSGLKSGIYFVNVLANNVSDTRKIVVQ